MAIELDVPVGDALDALRFHDARAVHQGLGRDEHVVDVERVIGRDPQVAGGDAVGDRPRLDTDRQDSGVGVCKAADEAARADPADRAGRAGGCHHPIADLQRLDSDLATIREDLCAGAVARRVVGGVRWSSWGRRRGAWSVVAAHRRVIGGKAGPRRTCRWARAVHLRIRQNVSVCTGGRVARGDSCACELDHARVVVLRRGQCDRRIGVARRSIRAVGEGDVVAGLRHTARNRDRIG